MSSGEAYLDSLLAALNGETKEEPIIEESEQEEQIAVEPTPIVPISDDPNKALGADEIAALFAQANVDMETGDVVEETEEVVEEVVEEAAEEVDEPIMITPVSDDPNKALGADEIAALFAQANVDMETGDVIEETEEVVEEVVEEAAEEVDEPIVITPISDDPNKALGADEIAALFAQANVDMETGDVIEETEEVVEEVVKEATEEVNEPITITPISDDPNKALGADEIAALFAQANMDMETGEVMEDDSVEEEKGERTSEDSEIDLMEGMSLDDMLAQMMDEDESVAVAEETEAEATDEDFDENSASEIQEEIEIDMDNPEELEMLLGLGERPDWSAKKAEMSERDEEELLVAMGGENPDLNEINSLLNKLDNNELVGDGIEESVLVGFDESDYDSEEDPWLDELLGNGEEKKKKSKAKKEKKKFSLFGKKKKNEEIEEEISEEGFVPGFAEEVSQKDSEEVTDILQAFAEDNSDIPFDLFAESEEDGIGDLDLISMVEEDKKQGKKKSKKTDEKKGFFAKMLDVLTEEIPEDEEEIFKEKKPKKDKKGKKKPVTDADDNEGILEELDAEENGGKKGKKAKKDKKPKKEKKKKSSKAMDDSELMDMVQDSKKLPMKMVARIVALCASIMALILLVNHFVPKLWSLADARNAFYKQDYETTYQEMSGKELSESDQRLYEKAKMILQMKHKVDAYESYKEMGMSVEALDSLLSGYLLWQELGVKIEEYDALAETEEIKVEIVNALSTEYQISEEEAAQINSLSNYEYTLRLEEMTGSLSRYNSTFNSEKDAEEEVPIQEEITQQETQQPQEPTEDVLSEEEVQ